MEILLIFLFLYGLIVLLGYGLGLFFGLLMTLCQIIGLILPKTTRKTITKKTPIATKQTLVATPMTAKEKLELKVGLIGMGYTALFIGIAILTDVPAYLLFVGWLVVSAIVSVFANKQLQHITSQ
ncbi:hypothetical protein [Moraxella nasicaprae]|uniref:Inner membrane protein ybaN n=1 Tax=Moraxella nasicaprae TaxID=2904122 RepID=A0ABY6F416_9GAMM|nr:hypothetical protein [Moraxella nasicaprae]UXZ04851.1 hypothetical protein LU297_09865 [Moraxella nasicaprae]